MALRQERKPLRLKVAEHQQAVAALREEVRSLEQFSLRDAGAALAAAEKALQNPPLNDFAALTIFPFTRT